MTKEFDPSEATLPVGDSPTVPAADPNATYRQPVQPRRSRTGVFQDGEVLAGRYRIEGLLGRGGMGEVYEAVDQELGERIALKVVLGEATAAAIDRFRREIQLARRVTHPNVSRIFELGYADREGTRVMFVTMELLQGESLSTFIRTRERITPEEALPLIRQMAAALAAAHDAGIVHRDFKSPNVLLTGNGTRAVVTDFGLARVHGGDPALESLTATDMVVGTPAYMAPEQLAGEEVGPAADIYAFGTVIYEMMTGVLPYTGGTAFSNAVRRLNEPPPSPRLHRPDLPPAWEATILQCLERDPTKRPQSALAVAEQLTSARAVAPPEPMSRRVHISAPRRRAGLIAGMAVAALIVIAVAVAIAMLRARGVSQTANPPVAAARIPMRPSFAVLPFVSEDRAAATAAAEVVHVALGADGVARVAPRTEMTRIMRDLSLAPAERLFSRTAEKLLPVAGVRSLVTGSVTRDGDQWRIRVSVHRGDGGAVQLDGAGADLTETAIAIAADVREKSGLARPPRDTAPIVAAHVPPPNVSSYFEGLEAWRSLDRAAARRLLRTAVDQTPAFPFGRLALAEVSKELGLDAEARTEARAAFDAATYLSAEDRAYVEARYRAISANWQEAARAYRRLIELRPDDIDHRLGLARVQIEAGDGKGALATVAEARRLNGADAEDARLDLAEARAAEPLGDYALKERAATRAAAKAAATGERELLAQARFFLGQVAHGRGQFDAALAAYAESRQLYEALRDRDETARLMSTVAVLLEDRGDFDAAMSMYVQAGDLWRRSGNQRGVADALNNRAILSARRAKDGEAESLWQAALKIYEGIRDHAGIAMTLNNLGFVAQRQGQLAESRALLERSLAASREIGDRWTEAETMASLGNVLRMQGSHATSAKMLGDAVLLLRSIAHERALAMALGDLAATRIRQGQLGDAATLAADASALAAKAGDQRAQLHALLVTAQLQFDRGELDAESKTLSEALALSEQAADDAGKVRSLVQIARSRLVRGDLDAAASAAKAAADLAERTEGRIGVETVRVIAAAIESERGRGREAQRLASEARRFFAERGMVDRAVEAAVVEARAIAAADPAASEIALRSAEAAAANAEAPVTRILPAVARLDIARMRGRRVDLRESAALGRRAEVAAVPRLREAVKRLTSSAHRDAQVRAGWFGAGS